MKIYLFSFLSSLFFLFSACKKEAGEGGTSSVRGKVFAVYYDKYFFGPTDSTYAPDVDVYIIYGDNYTYGERQRTSNDGRYEFKYLRKGKYTIYAYSRDSTGRYINQVNTYAPDVAIIENVEVKKNRETVDVKELKILR